MSERATSLIVSHPLWNPSREILIYHAIADEVDTSRLVERASVPANRMRSGEDRTPKRFFLPRVVGSDLVFHRSSSALERHSFGMLEPLPDAPRWSPSPVSPLVCVVCPGRAFDTRGNRLGRGGGFYDRFLRTARAELGDRIVTIGLAFSVQVVESVPVVSTDEPMDFVATDAELIDCRIEGTRAKQ